jgi:5'(3')-deoxyribonucleotidase
MKERIKLFSDKIIRKKIKPGERIFIDMDNCLVNFESGINKLSKRTRDNYAWEDLDDVPGIFSKMEPNEGAVEVVNKLAQKYDLYILSTAPWKNSTAWSDKLLWVQKYFGKEKNSIFYKKIILTHHKDFELFSGAYLIDDRLKNGSEMWDKYDKLIHFGNSQFPNWEAVGKFLLG